MIILRKPGKSQNKCLLRNCIPSDGGYIGCGIWQRLMLQNSDNCLNSKHEPLRRRVLHSWNFVTKEKSYPADHHFFAAFPSITVNNSKKMDHYMATYPGLLSRSQIGWLSGRITPYCLRHSVTEQNKKGTFNKTLLKFLNKFLFRCNQENTFGKIRKKNNFLENSLRKSVLGKRFWKYFTINDFGKIFGRFSENFQNR